MARRNQVQLEKVDARDLCMLAKCMRHRYSIRICVVYGPSEPVRKASRFGVDRCLIGETEWKTM